MSSKFSTVFLLICAATALIIAYYLYSVKRPLRTLPVYGAKEYDPVKKDTVYHIVMDFHLKDQMGQVVTLDTFNNKIFVANFFYTSCPGICKKMNNELERVSKHFSGNPNVKFLSYTVDPLRDSVQVLKTYSDLHSAIPYQWYFLTGDKNQIYTLARKSYYAAIDDSAGNNFVHTQYIALVDRNKHIRGIYNGTDSAEVNKMMDDIQLLLNLKP